MLKKFTLVFFILLLLLLGNNSATSAQVVLTITDPAVACSPGGVNITNAAITAGSTLPTGTILTYYKDAGGTLLLSAPSFVTTSGTYYIKATNGVSSDIKPVVVIINPIPVLSITNPPPVCSFSTVDITASAVTAGSVGATTQSYYSNAAVTIALATPSAITTSGTYYIKATTTLGCSSVAPVIVTINPPPIVTSAATNTICNNTAQAYTITSNVAGTTFSWSRPVVAGISNPLGLGTSSTITETLTNTTSLPVNVVYNITPNSSTCTGAVFTYTVTVNPTATIISAPTDAICNNVAQSYAILSATPFATYTWARPVIAGISNSAASGSSATIAETLINTTTSPINVAYTIVPQTAAGCPGTPFVHTITVNPSPTLIIANPAVVCTPSTIDITNPAITAGSNLPGGSTLSYYTDPATTTVLVNPAAITISGNYYIKATTATGCSNVAAVVATLHPATTPTFTSLPAICSGSPAPTLSTTSTNGITGTWSPSIVSNTATGTYIFTPTAGQCATTTSLVQTIITPGIIPLFTPLAPICNGSTAPTLPNTSINAITGIWSPATVGNVITGTYTFTPAAGQCATTTTLTQIVRQASTSTTNVAICPSSLPYVWNTVSHNAAGTYTVTLVNYIGCDSVATLNLAVATALPPLVVTNPLGVCSPGTVDITNPAIAINNSFLPQGTVLNYYAAINDIAISNPLPTPNAISTSGVYYIQATSIAGCTNNPVTVAVTILASPSADAGTDKTTCDGSAAVIGSPQIPNFNYSWQPATGLNNATIAQPTVSGLLSSTKYILTVTAVSNGCFSKDSVLVNLLPLHISLPDTIKQTCVGSTVSIGLDALPNCNYSWTSAPAGFTSTLSNPSVVAPSVLTSYYVTATDTQTGCHGSAYVTVAIDSCIAANNAPVLAYPNPANQYVSIKFNQTETGTLYFQLINDKGQVVINNTITYSYPLTINVAALPAGKYYYTILNSSGKTLKSDRIMILR